MPLDIHNMNNPHVKELWIMRRDRSVSAQPALLGLLMSKPQHGYELHQAFERDLGRVWHIGLSQLYSQLKQLEEAGLVCVETVPQDNRPPRKVYHLTPEGEAVFTDWVHQPTPYLRHIRVEFLARLYFFRQLALPGLDELVTQQARVCQARVGHFDELLAGTEDPFRRCVLEFRRGQLEAVIRWLERCLEVL
jgi:DNA-binding PadR family transcriptional regulator